MVTGGTVIAWLENYLQDRKQKVRFRDQLLSEMDSNTGIPQGRDQAILFNTLENCTINDYLEGLSQHTEPKNIIFASRISNGRICIYLSSKNLVDKFIAETKKIIVNGNILEARRLITPSVRLILSNECPSIPSNLIMDELIKLDNFVLPESFIIELEQTSYRIFIAQNENCFKCKLTGHHAANCPNISPSNHSHNDSAIQTEMRQNSSINHTQQDNLQNTPAISNTTPSTLTTSSQTTLQTVAIPNLSINQTQQCSLQNTSIHLTTSPVNTTIATPTSSESSSNTQKHKSTLPETKNFEKPKLQLKKKTKTDDKNLGNDIPNLQTLLEPVREYIQREKQLLSFDQVVDLFENIQGSKDIISVTKLYSEDSHALIKFLSELHPYYIDRRMKTKSTKLIRKLGKYICLLSAVKTPLSEEDSDSSINNSSKE
ncbi:unnamed protein product [Diabrotica balteata]|uniref:CCHC-type domain-containing protein n=1 Tax=Diabrotica balteata TaxID=107213 RepID=A0A9N9T300_DIABA|nr:unnamed protein product [Diabrotica balteata]